jgi:thiosulfate dehydrogenase [quinone] large subunit
MRNKSRSAKSFSIVDFCDLVSLPYRGFRSLTFVPIDDRHSYSKMDVRSTQDQKGVSVMEYIRELLGEPSAVKTPKLLTSVQRSKVLAFGWTAMRVWLGIMWIQAGTAKLWGAENPAFLHNNGAGVAGFATHGVPAYSWWGSFMHTFVVPNAGWIAILVAVAEFSIGVALSLGLFTRIAALGSLALLFTYVMSGTASVCAFYAFFAIVILATWRTSSWIGVDGLISGYRQRHQAQKVSATTPSIVGALATKDVSGIASTVATSLPVVTSADQVTSTKDEPVAVS